MAQLVDWDRRVAIVQVSPQAESGRNQRELLESPWTGVVPQL